MNNFKKYGFLIAIIFSILLHLIFINNFSFKIFQTDNKEDLKDFQVTLIESISSEDNLSDKEKPSSKVPLTISKKNAEKKINFNIISQKKEDTSQENTKSKSSQIDTSRILSQIRNMSLSTETENIKMQKRVKSISASTTDYLYKLYFEAWRQKVESIGAMNYPKEASELGMFGSLRLTVSLNSDGMIKNLFINKSSGYKELDQAALNIVKLGEPYAKFPAEINKNVDIINITRKWKFTEKNNFFK
ncbi:TonB family protein [Methylophilaceae bacterium]|nr:TonB family protein [Methylophilaceae bacterium]|tara:strand:+ start:2336 stop:3073 length:738 start_codon:yes stop_codon:yes gene_type:complete